MSGAPGFGNFGAPGTGGRSSYRVLVSTLPDNSHLLVGRSAEDLESFRRTIDAALAFTLLLIAALAGAVSVLVTRRTVGRIESINATSRAIMERGLAARIRLRGVNDEWDELARNLNSMLDRIEALMREVREVTDNVAHDLRTPLARIRGRLEKASGSPRGAESDQKLIDDMIGDLDDVLRIFSSLMPDRRSSLRLARRDSQSSISRQSRATSSNFSTRRRRTSRSSYLLPEIRVLWSLGIVTSSSMPWPISSITPSNTGKRTGW